MLVATCTPTHCPHARKWFWIPLPSPQITRMHVQQACARELLLKHQHHDFVGMAEVMAQRPQQVSVSGRATPLLLTSSGGMSAQCWCGTHCLGC